MHFARKVFYTLKSFVEHPLNRDSKASSLARYCVAQAGVRMVSGDIGVPFPNDTKLLISPRMKGATHFISPGLCEFDEMCFVSHFLRPGDLFVDVGANVGAYTLLASGVAAARTVAFEPNPSTFRYLAENVRMNDLEKRVTMYNAAVGRGEGRLRLTDDLGTENFVCVDGHDSSGVEVRVMTLDAALENSAPTLIKVDVEGFEVEVFGGGEKTLLASALQAMIVERNGLATRYGFDEAGLHGKIRSLGFVPCAYSAIDRRLTRVDAEVQGNIIYVRDFSLVQDRLKTAPPFRFKGRQI